MATWTTITDTALEPGKPIRSVDGLALRDNVTALAEGAAGAPRIENAAMDTDSVDNANVVNATLGAEKFQTGTTERDWVLARNAGAGAGVIGTYAFAWTALSRGFGAIVSGGNLFPSDTVDLDSSSLPGTWKCMGSASGSSSTLWLRIS